MLALVLFVVLCGLGTWQLQRLAWKQDLIDRVESRTELAPVAAPGPAEWPDIDFDELDYRPVAATGTYRHDLEAHAYVALSNPAGPLGGQGYFILTPLETTEGWPVIVNRGFVPEENKDPSTRSDSQIEGEVRIVGLLRQPQGGNAFTPADDIDGNIWFTRDPAAIGEAFGLGPDLAPYYIDVPFDPAQPGGLPQGGETLLSFPNNHLQYAVTWYGLAAVLAVIFVLRWRAGRRRGV
jgi:surfeit locus 1 family protein